jgi:hypothetical protein
MPDNNPSRLGALSAHVMIAKHLLAIFPMSYVKDRIACTQSTSPFHAAIFENYIVYPVYLQSVREGG